MSNVNTRCGIYAITAPSGSTYIGSSNKIERRWHEHRSMLRHGKHHSVRLQSAWKKYAGTLQFSVLMECPESELNEREQQFIDSLHPRLNTSTFVRNIWQDAEVKAKFQAIHASPEWREMRRKIAGESTTRWIAVDCDDGRSFKNMADAARAFGVRISAITHLVKTQRSGRLAVRFKLASDEWRVVVTAAEQRHLTAIANGKTVRSAEARARMSAAKKGRPVSPQCLAAATAENRRAKAKKAA